MDLDNDQAKNFYKRFTPQLLWTIVGVLLFVVVAGSVAWYKTIKDTQRLIELNSQQLDENKQKDWKTYKNDQYGIEFKYPSYLHESKDQSAVNNALECFTDNNVAGASICVNVLAGKLDKNKISYVYRGNKIQPKLSEKNVDGKTGYYFDHEFSGVECYEGPEYRLPLNEAQSLSLTTSNCIDLVPNIENDLDKILSTFKFITPDYEITQSGSQKIYKNSRYGFEFRTPADMIIEHEYNDEYSFTSIGLVSAALAKEIRENPENFKGEVYTYDAVFRIDNTKINSTQELYNDLLRSCGENFGWTKVGIIDAIMYNACDLGSPINIVFVSKGYEYIVDLGFGNAKKPIGKDIILKQVLPTFKFTK